MRCVFPPIPQNLNSDNLEQYFHWNLGVVLKSAPVQASASGVREKVKRYDVLALVDLETKNSDTKGGIRSMSISDHPCSLLTALAPLGTNSVPPIWPPRPENLVKDLTEYDLRTVPLSSIAMVTESVIKVRPD